MSKSHTELSLEILIENLKAVRFNFESKPLDNAFVYLNALIESYEDQLKKAQDEQGTL